MSLKSVNPYNGAALDSIKPMKGAAVESALEATDKARHPWALTVIEERCRVLGRLGDRLRARRDECAEMISREMGKVITEARAEIDKCAWLCDYYAETAPSFLSDESIETSASESYVAYQPLGTVLGIMPWNFPFWQVIRYASAAITAGNTVLLKHAGNVQGCARLIEELFREASYPEGVFQTLYIESDQVRAVIEDDRVHAVTLTGSERAGSAVASHAGAALKKTVLELGGSDAFIVLEDADLEKAVKTATTARFQASGQSCIAAKRFILSERIADEFIERFKTAAESLVMGDPMDENTTLGPMAREDLRDELHEQVKDALGKGARAVTGCEVPDRAGWFYPPSIIDGITPEMRAWKEEMFGPVASVIRVKDEKEAIEVANASPYGLGGSVWTRDVQRGERLALQLESGGAYVNAMTKSDPRTPFGGVKRSGYGRELGSFGLREFVNIKTIWIA